MTFKTDEYEYRPAFFEEIRCSNINYDDVAVVGLDKEGKVSNLLLIYCFMKWLKSWSIERKAKSTQELTRIENIKLFL